MSNLDILRRADLPRILKVRTRFDLLNGNEVFVEYRDNGVVGYRIDNCHAQALTDLCDDLFTVTQEQGVTVEFPSMDLLDSFIMSIEWRGFTHTLDRDDISRMGLTFTHADYSRGYSIAPGYHLEVETFAA